MKNKSYYIIGVLLIVIAYFVFWDTDPLEVEPPVNYDSLIAVHDFKIDSLNKALIVEKDKENQNVKEIIKLDTIYYVKADSFISLPDSSKLGYFSKYVKRYKRGHLRISSDLGD